MRLARQGLCTTQRSEAFWSRVMIRTTPKLTLAGVNYWPAPGLAWRCRKLTSAKLVHAAWGGYWLTWCKPAAGHKRARGTRGSGRSDAG